MPPIKPGATTADYVFAYTISNSPNPGFTPALEMVSDRAILQLALPARFGGRVRFRRPVSPPAWDLSLLIWTPGIREAGRTMLNKTVLNKTMLNKTMLNKAMLNKQC
jgi:hypothetical protein